MKATQTVPTEALYRQGLRDWLANLRPTDIAEATTEGRDGADGRFVADLYETGWNRWGWPVEVGGFGGGAALRAAMYDEIAEAGRHIPFRLEAMETLAPSLVRFAPHLAVEFLPLYLRGEEQWCQGFSEPEAGSDLAALSCRATAVKDDFVVNGQKTWTSHGHLAERCALLVRTGPPDSRHRGLTMLFVDMDAPGVETRSLRTCTGQNELSEVFFTDVRVPANRVIGEVDGGWDVAMYLLQYERGMFAWMRQCSLRRVLRKLGAEVEDPSDSFTESVGAAHVSLQALRARCRRTVARLESGERVGSETSVDKVLLGRAEHVVHDLLWEADPVGFTTVMAEEVARASWFYSRAATIYGGAIDIQKNIIAERLLGLPRGTT